MAIEDIIATGVRPVAEYAAENEKVRALQQDNAQAPQRAALLAEQTTNAQLINQEKQLSLKDEQIQRDAMTQANGDPDQFIKLLAKNGARPATVFAAQQNLFTTRKNAIALSEDQRKDLEQRHEQYRGILEAAQEGIKANPANAQPIWEGVLQKGAQVDPEDVKGQPAQYPGDDHLTLLHNSIGMAGSILKEANERAVGAKTVAETDKAAADALLAKTKSAGEQIDTETKQRAADAVVLAAAAKSGPDALRSALDQMPHGRARVFEGQTDPNEILKLGMSPTDITKTTQEAAKAIEEKRWHDVQAGFEKGKLGVEQAKLALSQKEFTAKFGSPESRSAFTESVVKNPDSYFSLPPDMKPGVAADLVARGMSVPTQLPSDIKSRSASAGLTLQSIQRVRALLADPDVAGAIGPISGRLGNLEQNVGDTFFGEKDPRAQKEQQLRTELAYLKFQESKGLFGGRPAQQLIKSLSGVSANPTMSQNLITGSLAAMENSMKAVGNEARAFSFGGAEGAVNNAAQQQAPAATYAVGDTVKIKGKAMKVTQVHPDGSFDAK